MLFAVPNPIKIFVFQRTSTLSHRNVDGVVSWWGIRPLLLRKILESFPRHKISPAATHLNKPLSMHSSSPSFPRPSPTRLAQKNNNSKQFCGALGGTLRWLKALLGSCWRYCTLFLYGGWQPLPPHPKVQTFERCAAGRSIISKMFAQGILHVHFLSVCPHTVAYIHCCCASTISMTT